jgi:type VI secretion system ImpJ/VasE family protein
MHVHWHEGLFLQPHHLQLQLRGLQSDIRSARSLFNPYAFGLIESRLSYDNLNDGRVLFERLQAIMPSGQEISYPENTNLPPLDLKTELSRSAAPIDVVLAVPLWSRSRANAFRPGETADPRVKLLYIPHEARDLPDENNGDNPQTVILRKVNARLVMKEDDLSDLEFLPLMRLVRATGEGGGKAQLDPEFVPPCLLLRSSAALHELTRDLLAYLNACREQWRLKAAGGTLGLETKWEVTSKLKTLNRFCASLPSLVEEGVVSPFLIYLQMRELLGELLALSPDKNLFDCEPYDHLNPLRCFREIDGKIRPLIRPGKEKEPYVVPFTGAAGLVRAELEPKHFEPGIGYFLGVKTKVDFTRLVLHLKDLNKFKFMPRSMEQMAIQGLELKEETSPPLDLHRANNLHYFRVVVSSNARRWEQIKQDKAIALVWNNAQFDLSDAEFTLSMTLP